MQVNVDVSVGVNVCVCVCVCVCVYVESLGSSVVQVMINSNPKWAMNLIKAIATAAVYEYWYRHMCPTWSEVLA